MLSLTLLSLFACLPEPVVEEPEVLAPVAAVAPAPTSTSKMSDAAAEAAARSRKQELAHPEDATAPRVDDAVSAFAKRFHTEPSELSPQAREALADADPDLLDPEQEAIEAAKRLQIALAEGDADAAERAIAEGRVFGMPSRLVCIGQAAVGRLREGWSAERVMTEPVLDDPSICGE